MFCRWSVRLCISFVRLIPVDCVPTALKTRSHGYCMAGIVKLSSAIKRLHLHRTSLLELAVPLSSDGHLQHSAFEQQLNTVLFDTF